MGNKIFRILLVDDDTDVLAVSEKILQRLGYNVVAFTSGIEALDFFKELPDHFDLVITDYFMPGINGAELCREILRIKPDMPVIMCSGFAKEFSEEDAKFLGIKGFFRKPLLKKDFAILVESVLRRRHVLLVEDDPETLLLYQEVFELLGCSVAPHADSNGALELFKAQPDRFDLVLTDYNMPGMNGAELSRQILQIKPGMPIIMCTGYTCDFCEKDAKAAGIKCYSEKPVGMHTLTDLFEKAISDTSSFE